MERAATADRLDPRGAGRTRRTGRAVGSAHPWDTRGVPDNLAPRGLLAVFAHPDDESFGAAGVLAMAVRAGVPVTLVCATNGDLGGPDQAHEMDPEIRHRELRTAMAALGVGEPIFLGYNDSGMENWERRPDGFAQVDPEAVVGRLVSIIRQVAPGVVLTFDPGGVYGHPDHVAISERATAAYRRTSGLPDGPRFLYHQAIPRSGIEEMRRIDEAQATLRGTPPREPTEDELLQQRRIAELARPDEEITTVVDVRPVLDRKLAALAAHESQMRDGSWGQAPRELIERWLGSETFVRVDPPATPGLRETWLGGLPDGIAR